MSGRLRRRAPRRPAGRARVAVAGDARGARRPRAVAARRRLPAPEPGRHHDPVRQQLQRFWMAVGIAGGWMLAILGLSYYARARIGVARWRALHRFTALAWILGIAHALGQGTDAGTPWFLLGLAMVALPGLALLAARLMPRRGGRRAIERDRHDVRLLRRQVRRVRGRRRGRQRRGGGPSPAARLAHALHALRPRQRAVAAQRRHARSGAGQRRCSRSSRRVSVDAAELTGGLVDATLVGELERAGLHPRPRRPPPPPASRCGSRRRAAPAGRPRRRGGSIAVDGLTIRRPPGLALDSGGIAKGLFADLLAASSPTTQVRHRLRRRPALRRRRAAPSTSPSPFGGGPLHTFELADAAVATSGIGRRSWIDGDGRPAHHLLDPATGPPASPASCRRPRSPRPPSRPRSRAKAARAQRARGGPTGSRTAASSSSTTGRTQVR